MRKKQRGFLFILSLFALTGLLTLTVVGLGRSLTETSAATRFVAKQQAFHLADAGVDEAVWEFEHSSGNFLDGEGWTSISLTPCSASPVCPNGTCRQKILPLTEGSGTTCATVTVMDVAGPTSTILATGLASGIQQTIEARFAQRNPGPVPFMFARNGINLGANVRVDSYDSTQGLYTPAPATTNRTQIHAVTTNSTAQDTVLLHSGAVIDGDLIIGPGGIPSVVVSSSGGSITGTSYPASTANTPPPITPPVDAPCGQNFLSVAGAQAMTVADFQKGCYSSIQITGSLTLNGDGVIVLDSANQTDLSLGSKAKLTLNGHITLVTGGIHLQSQAQLEIPSNGQAAVAVFVKDYASFEAQSGINNLTKIPSKCTLYYSGSNALAIHSGVNWYGVVDAPNAEVDVDSQAQIYGSIIAESLHLQSQVGFHADKALADDPLFGFARGLRMWRQP